MKWAQAPASREQILLFRESLDDAIGADHPIRCFDVLLKELNWKAWEARYDPTRGQPAVHPRLVAGVILWGALKGIRSSRKLEEATGERLDLLWFLERRSLDHSTLAKFRVRFERELKDLTRQLSQQVVDRSCGEFMEIILDGTRMRADSDRCGARTAEALERLIADCEKKLRESLDQLAQGDLFEVPETQEAEVLQQEMERLHRQLEKYERALEVARKRDVAKEEIFGSKATPVRVPVTDADSTLMPNKEGGFAPNYTPVLAVDSQSGAIVYGEIVEGSDESPSVAAAVQEVQENLGQKPQRLLADTGFASGPALEFLEEAQVDAYMPTGTLKQKQEPVQRAEPSEPISPERWKDLPRKGKQLDRSAFVYDAEGDQYYCPMGKALKRFRRGRYQYTGYQYVSYRCPGRVGCPLAERCVRGKAKYRTVQRDEYQELRDRVDKRMATEDGKKIYKRRAPVIEGVFGIIKHVLGVRRFLLRGIDQVRIEWNWICAAFNLKKLLQLCRTGKNPVNYRLNSVLQRLVCCSPSLQRVRAKISPIVLCAA